MRKSSVADKKAQRASSEKIIKFRQVSAEIHIQNKYGDFDDVYHFLFRMPKINTSSLFAVRLPLSQPLKAWKTRASIHFENGILFIFVENWYKKCFYTLYADALINKFQIYIGITFILITLMWKLRA